MKIAITGGIGSGKSYVCRILEKHGIRVYDCDAGAKRLMRQDADLQAGLKKLVGEEVYSADGILQKPVLAQFILTGEANKQAVNDVVHPAVARDFEQSDCEWMESAILLIVGSIIVPISIRWYVSRLPLPFVCSASCSAIISLRRRRSSG